MLPLLRKSKVKAHTRKTKSGKVAQVRAHTDSRSKKAAPLKGAKAKAEAIAQLYADTLHKKLVKMHGLDYGHDGSVTDDKRAFARAILKKDVYALKFITNGMNQAALKTFTKTTGVKMPRSQSGQWAELLKWGGVSKRHDEKVTKHRDAHYKFESAQKWADRHTVRYGDKDMSIRQVVDDLIGQGYVHYSQTPNKKKEHYLVKMGDDGKRLAIKLSGKAALRPAIEYAQAHAEFKKTKLKKSRSLHGCMDFQGLKISIENRRGSLRQWYDPHNKESGTTRMKHPYGYIKMTEGNDGDHVDCYVGPHKDAKKAYVVHQMKAPSFKVYDEDKIMLGFLSAYEARAAYLAHYNDKRFLGSITIMPMEKFKDKVLDTKDKPGKLSKAVSEIFLIKR